MLDEDLTVNGTLTLSGGAQLDLSGHVLTVKGLSATAGTAGTANIVANGSFETTTGAPASGFKYFDSSCYPNGWTCKNSGFTHTSDGTWKSVNAPDGNWAVFMQNKNARMETDVDAAEAGMYRLTLNYGGRPKYTENSTLTVELNGVEVARVASGSITTASQTLTVRVPFAKGSNTLTIRNAGDGCMWIDNVKAVKDAKPSIFDSTTDAANPGELRFAVDSGVTSAMVCPEPYLDGNLRFVKTGPGFLWVNKGSSYDKSFSPTFTGGTWVEGGVVAPQQANETGNDLTYGYDNFKPFGTRRRDMITVLPGGMFDVRGNWCYRTSIILAGGAIRNQGYAHSHGYGNEHGYGPSKLTADSTNLVNIEPSSAGNAADRKAAKFGSSDAAWNDLDLGGFTLTSTIKDDRQLYLLYAHITNGTFKVEGGTGTLRPYASAINMRTATLDIDCALNMTQTINVDGYISRYTGSSNAGTAALNVYGTFTPVPGAKYYGCTMQDGSTIDVTAWSEALPLAGGFTSGDGTVKCPSGTVAVYTGGREIAVGDQLLSWSSMPAAAFELSCDGPSAAERELAVFKDSGGLYVKSTAVPDYATLDVENDSWRFWKENGTELTDVYEGDAPTAEMAVRFSTFAEYAGIKAKVLSGDVSPAYCYATSLAFDEGTAAFDMSGLDFQVAEGMAIDVKGNTLKLPFSTVCGATAFTVTSSVAGGALEVEVPEGQTAVNTATALGGLLKLVKTGGGVFASSKSQAYTGGTLVSAGTARPKDGVAGANNYYDYAECKWFGTGGITVAEGGTFDCRGWHCFRTMIALDGGTLANSHLDMDGYWRAGSGVGAVTKDSSVDVSNSLVFGDKNNTKINLAGHRLSCTVASGKTLYFTANVATNGTLAVSGEGKIRFENAGYNTTADRTKIDLSSTALELSAAVDMSTSVDVGDYAALYDGTANGGGTGVLSVSGTFKPAGAGFYGPTMAGGSTIDFSEWEGEWPLVSSAAAGRKTVTFASGTEEAPATVNVKLAPVSANLRALAREKGYLLEWEGGAAPEYVSFVQEPGSRGQMKVVADETGLRLVRNTGLTIIIK